MRALELGSAPGSWSQVLSARKVSAVAVDCLPMDAGNSKSRMRRVWVAVRVAVSRLTHCTTPLPTPTYPYLPLQTPAYPYLPLPTPTYPYRHLPTPTDTYLPLPTPAHPYLPLRTPYLPLLYALTRLALPFLPTYSTRPALFPTSISSARGQIRPRRLHIIFDPTGDG